jgi:hypothetical protein
VNSIPWLPGLLVLLLMCLVSSEYVTLVALGAFLGAAAVVGSSFMCFCFLVFVYVEALQVVVFSALGSNCFCSSEVVICVVGCCL